MTASATINSGKEFMSPDQESKRAWSAPTIADEDASRTAAGAVFNPSEIPSTSTPQGPS